MLRQPLGSAGGIARPGDRREWRLGCCGCGRAARPGRAGAGRCSRRPRRARHCAWACATAAWYWAFSIVNRRALLHVLALVEQSLLEEALDARPQVDLVHRLDPAGEARGRCHRALLATALTPTAGRVAPPGCAAWSWAGSSHAASDRAVAMASAAATPAPEVLRLVTFLLPDPQRRLRRARQLAQIPHDVIA